MRPDGEEQQKYEQCDAHRPALPVVPRAVNA
jgi:hypothetical protein